MGRRGVSILGDPLLGRQVIVPTVIVFQVFGGALFGFHIFGQLLSLLQTLLDLLGRYFDEGAFLHRLIQSLRASSWSLNFGKLLLLEIVNPLHLCHV